MEEEVEVEVPVFFRGICRACIKTNKELFPLFGGAKIKFGDKCFTISEILFLGGRVKTNFDDKLPNHVCRRCLTRLIEIFSFQLKCIESDIKLKSILSKNGISSKKESELLNQTNKEEDNLKQQSTENQNPAQDISEDPNLNETVTNEHENENIKNNSNNSKGSISDIVVSILEDKDQQVSVSMTLTLNDKSQTRQLQDSKLNQDRKDITSKDDNICSIKHTSNPIQLPNEINEDVVITDVKSESEKKHGKFICTFCKDSFDTWSDLGKHMVKHKIQNNYGRLKSESPTLEFSSDIDLKEGILCTLCSKQFNSQESYDIHMENHDNNTSHHDCNEQTNEIKLSVLSEQEMPILTPIPQPNNGKKRFYCDFCPANYKYRQDIKKHLVEKHIAQYPNDQKYECSVCGKLFIWHLELTQHEKLHKENAKKQNKITATEQSNLLQRYKCLRCSKLFYKLVHMHRHLVKKHKVKVHGNYQKINREKYSCSICNKKFLKYLEMIKHRRQYCNIKTKNYDISKFLEKDENLSEDETLNSKDPLSFETQNENILEEIDDNNETCNTEINQVNKKHKEIETSILNDVDMVNEEPLDDKRFCCNYCPSNYRHQNHLQRHVVLKHTEDLSNDENAKNDEAIKVMQGSSVLWKCKKCPALYMHRKSVHSHFKNKHGKIEIEKLKPVEEEKVDDDDFKCKTCNRVFKTLITLNMHIFMNHRKKNNKPIRILNEETGVNMYKCKLCDIEFSNLFGWQSHTANKHKEKNISGTLYECSTCKKTFLREHSLKCHLKVHEFSNPSATYSKPDNESNESLPIDLEIKSEINSSLLNLSNNSDINNTLVIHKCLICPSVVASRKTLRRHIKVHHSEKLKQHEDEKTDNHLFQCPECYKWFLAQKYLRNHMKRHYNIQGIKELKCDFCEKNNFQNAKDYSQHLKVHRSAAKKDKRYCKECLIIYSSERSYKLHMMVKHKIAL